MTATGSVTGGFQAGISAVNEATAGDLFVRAIDVSITVNDPIGVSAVNLGNGAASMISTGSVTGASGGIVMLNECERDRSDRGGG